MPGHIFNEGDTRPGTIYYKEPNFSRIMKMTSYLSEIAEELNITLSQLVLNWTIRQPGITCVLSGARNDAQVLENVKAAEFKLNNEDIARINKHLSGLRLETKI
jgi:aryl-alcohol dehydrogenase-like predicted oxidoreductase